MTITITSCHAGQRRSCEELIRDAFWDLYRPGCVEHLIAHQSWDAASIALVATDDDANLVGCLIGTRAEVVSDQGSTAALYLGPLGVTVSRQRQGIGSALLREGLRRGAECGFTAAFLFGDPEYYPRFGFRNAAELGVSTAGGDNFDAFMGLELGSTPWVGRGRLIEGPWFEIDDEAVLRFDAEFPQRERHILPGQFGQ